MTARIAVIGCGSWATEAHLPALAGNADAEVIAVADTDLEACERVSRRFGITNTYRSHEELLAAEEPDGVIVATPHAHHFAPARAALEAGAHLLVEKPMVLEPRDGRELQRLARERGRELIVGYTWHYNRQARELRRLLAAGELGTLEFASSLFVSMMREYLRGDTEAYQPEFRLALAPRNDTYSDPILSGGGQGQAQVTHSAALVFWLTGLTPLRVAAFCEDFELGSDLVDAATVSFAGGAAGTIASSGDRPSGHQDLLHLQVGGSAGFVSYDVMEGRATISRPEGRRDELEPLPLEERYPHWGPATNLVDVILGRGENESPAEIGCLTVEFLAAMYRSAAAGGTPVDLASL